MKFCKNLVSVNRWYRVFLFLRGSTIPFSFPLSAHPADQRKTKKGHKKNFQLIEKSKEKRNEKRTCFFLRTSKNGLKWAFERNEEEENEKEKETVEPGVSTAPKEYISYSIIHAKDDCAGIYVLPQLGVFSAAGCGIAVSVLQNEIAKGQKFISLHHNFSKY